MYYLNYPKRAGNKKSNFIIGNEYVKFDEKGFSKNVGNLEQNSDFFTFAGIHLKNPMPYSTNLSTYSVEWFGIDSFGTRWPTTNFYQSNFSGLILNDYNSRQINWISGKYYYVLDGTDDGWVLSSTITLTGPFEINFRSKFPTDNRYLFSNSVGSNDRIFFSALNILTMTLSTNTINITLTDTSWRGDGIEHQMKIIRNAANLITIYIDNVSVGSSTRSTPILINQIGLKWGGATAATTYNGYFKDVNIYNSVLVYSSDLSLLGKTVQPNTASATTATLVNASGSAWQLINPGTDSTNYSKTIGIIRE